MYHQPPRNQMPPPPVYYPAMPPQIYSGNDPARFPSPNGHWPSDDGSHGCTYPLMQCHGHGCCNHNYFPGHFVARPPYPYHNHVPPAPSYHPFCYPAPQGMYPPVTYFPPHYATELPQYEYYKDLLNGDGHRCSGWCQKYPSNGEQGGNVKIVEEEPEVEKKTNSSLVPFEAKNHPYPVTFLQPNNIMNAEENKKLDDSIYKGRDENIGAQASQKQQQQPILWNGWFPYDMSRVQSSNQEEEKKNNRQQHEEGAKLQQPTMSMRQDEEKEGNQHQKDDAKQMSLPFPIFWMPYKPSVTDGEEKPEIATERDVSKKKSSSEGKVPLHSINFPPEKHTDNKEKPERNIPSEGSNVSNTNRVVKIIPVKQLKEQVEEDKKTSSKIEEIKNKPLEEGTHKESSSPRKTSKLPPVCLRVEPLPKRKGANGNSRSPTPPGDKRKEHNVGATQSPNLKKKGGEEDQSEMEGDGSKVAKKISKSTEGTADAANGPFRQGDVKLGCESGDNVSHDNFMRNENAKRSNDCKEDQAVDCDVGQKVSEDPEAKIIAAEYESLTTKSSTEEVEESKKEKFSDAEAATMIQATYRGFEVRKWKPLRKLKKLAEVKEEVAGIRRRIQALDSSCNVKDYDKEKNMIMEMIMNLLLKLDAVQGLHASIRDVRKSMAKELVSLQETIDSLVFMDKSSPALLEQPSGISSEEIPSDLKNEDINIELQKEGDVIEDHDLSKIDYKVSPPVEKCEEHQFHETDSLPNFKDFENSVARVNRESLGDELKDVPGGTSSEFLHGASDSTVIVGGNDKEHDDVQLPMEDSSRDDEELGKEMSNFEDVSEEEMGVEIPNIFSLGEHKQGPNTTYTSNDDHMRRQVSGHAVEEDSKDEEMIISSQEQEGPEEMQEGSQKGKEEEKITEDSKVEEMIISSQEQVATEEMQEGSQEGKAEEKIIDTVLTETVLPLGDAYAVDIPIELLKESENSPDPCEADEPDSGLEQEVDEITGTQKGQVLEKGQIEVSSTIHNDEQFEQAEIRKEQLEGDTGSVSGGEATLPLHEGVSSVINDDVQEELQKENQCLGTDNLSESGGCDDDKVVLVTTSKRETGGLREGYNHMANSCVEEEIQKNDYGLVSAGSEVVPPGVQKSDQIDVDADVVRPDVGADEIDVAADKVENITMPSPTGSQASLESETLRENDQENHQKLVEENEKLRDMMEKLLEAGSKQLTTISELSSRINNLEKRLATKKKKQQRIRRRPKALHPQGIKV